MYRACLFSTTKIIRHEKMHGTRMLRSKTMQNVVDLISLLDPLSVPFYTNELANEIAYLSPPMSHARRTFNLIYNTDFCALPTMISRYVQSEDPSSDFYVNPVKPDTYAYENLPKSLENMVVARDVEKGHCIAIKYGVDSLDFVENALVRFYGACGQTGSAFKLLERMPERNVVAWNSVLIGYIINRRHEWVARYFFWLMLSDGFKPDEFSLVSGLTAATLTDEIMDDIPKRVHGYMFKVGLDKNLHAANALLYFYAKWGGVRVAAVVARKLLAEMEEIKNVVTWNTMIVADSIKTINFTVLEWFKEFEGEKLVPNEITFAALLFFCVYRGWTKEGFAYFQRMTKEYGIEPSMEHYVCMVILLRKARPLKEAFEFTQKMHLKPNKLIWSIICDSVLITAKQYRYIWEIASRELDKLEAAENGSSLVPRYGLAY